MMHTPREEQLERALDAVWTIAASACRDVADGTACFTSLSDALASIRVEAGAALGEEFDAGQEPAA